MAKIRINGVNLHYEKRSRNEPALLFIHGNIASSRWWNPVWPELEKKLGDKFTLARLDLRGAGQSDKPGEGYTVPQYSSDARELVKELGVKNLIVVGHSMGGAIAMDMAVSEPDLVKGMILVNPAPAEGLVTPEERKPLLDQMVQDRNLMKMALSAVIPTAAHGDFFEALVEDAMIAGPTMVSNYSSLDKADYREQLKDIKIPTLIIYGMQDSLISIDMMERTRDAIPGSTLVPYEEVGHSPNVESPQRLVEDIVKFAMGHFG